MWGYDTFQDVKTGEWKLVLYWGKIKDSLSKLQKKEKIFQKMWDCYDYVRNKVDDKLLKGYIRLENREYSKYSCGEITLTELIKKIENEKG